MVSFRLLNLLPRPSRFPHESGCAHGDYTSPHVHQCAAKVANIQLRPASPAQPLKVLRPAARRKLCSLAALGIPNPAAAEPALRPTEGPAAPPPVEPCAWGVRYDSAVAGTAADTTGAAAAAGVGAAATAAGAAVGGWGASEAEGMWGWSWDLLDDARL
jgi:hypothetical protein